MLGTVERGDRDDVGGKTLTWSLDCFVRDTFPP